MPCVLWSGCFWTCLPSSRPGSFDNRSGPYCRPRSNSNSNWIRRSNCRKAAQHDRAAALELVGDPQLRRCKVPPTRRTHKLTFEGKTQSSSATSSSNITPLPRRGRRPLGTFRVSHLGGYLMAMTSVSISSAARRSMRLCQLTYVLYAIWAATMKPQPDVATLRVADVTLRRPIQSFI